MVPEIRKRGTSRDTAILSVKEGRREKKSRKQAFHPPRHLPAQGKKLQPRSIHLTSSPEPQGSGDPQRKKGKRASAQRSPQRKGHCYNRGKKNPQRLKLNHRGGARTTTGISAPSVRGKGKRKRLSKKITAASLPPATKGKGG